MKETEIAYAAGFFDADGTVSISGSPQAIHVNINITQKDRDVLEWIDQRFKGSIVRERDRYWRWTPSPKEAFLRTVEPYLVLKKERVRRLLAVYYDVAARRNGSTPLLQAEVLARTELITWFKTRTLATTGKPSTLQEG